MAYFGKVFKSYKDDNLEGLFKAIGAPDDRVKGIVNKVSTEKLTKDGDTYILETTGIRDITYKFKNGDTVEENIENLITMKSKFVVEGNVITQHQKGSNGKEVTFRREFADDSLTQKITLVGWDGVAHRHFKA